MDKIVEWVFQCYDAESGGFGGNVGHDPHILYTLSALQILAIDDKLEDERLDKEKVVGFIHYICNNHLNILSQDHLLLFRKAA